jgi:hypothetical protein
MDVYENNLPPNNIKNDESELFNKRQIIYNNIDELDEISNRKDKNKEKLSLRKKKNLEYLNQFRKDKLKRLNLYCNNNNNSIDYNEIIKQIPNDILNEFNETKNKYEFYLKYLSLPDEKDPFFYIKMFVIYQIHIYVNNDITNSSRPSSDLQNYLLKYLVYDYKKELLMQKIKIQNEIIQLFIIWNTYTDDDDTNTVFYEDQFIYFLFDLLENNIYSIEFKINILILFNIMIKGINTFNKIMQKFEIIKKIEKIFVEIQKDEQYIYVLSIIDNIIEFVSENYENILFNNSNNNNNKITLFMNSYETFILLLKNYYEKYQNLYDELKSNKTPLSSDNYSRIYYKIIIKVLKIINDSLFINDNKFYINTLISNNISLPLFYKIMEKFSVEFFLASNNVNNSNHKLKIMNNIYIETTTKYNTKNNLYKKNKVLIYITHILNEIISSISENEKDSDIIINNIIKNFNFINYYTNLIKNIVCAGIEPDKYLILRIEELIYNFCEGNKNHFIKIYQNYDLIRELLGINVKYYNEDNFLLLLKFIIYSLELYEPEVTGSLIFNVKIIGIFMKYLEKEYKSEKIYLDDKQRNIFYALNIILDTETYIKCKLNRHLIIQEFTNFNSNHIIFQYSINLEREDFEIVNKTLAYLDESDILDNREKEDIFN